MITVATKKLIKDKSVRHVRANVFVIAVLGGTVLLQSCADRDIQLATEEQELKVVDVRIVQVAQLPGTEWSAFQGVLKCVVLDPKSSNLTTGQQLNVVAARPESAKRGMFVHRGSNLSLNKGSEYTIAVDDRLPLGWQSIEGHFEDIRVGLVALVSVQEIEKK